PGKVRDNPAPSEKRPTRRRGAGTEGTARRTGLLLGLLIGVLATGALAVVACGVLIATGVFDKAKPEDTAAVDRASEKKPEPKPEVKPQPKPEPKPEPQPQKPEPKVLPPTTPGQDVQPET